MCEREEAGEGLRRDELLYAVISAPFLACMRWEACRIPRRSQEEGQGGGGGGARTRQDAVRDHLRALSFLRAVRRRIEARVRG